MLKNKWLIVLVVLLTVSLMITSCGLRVMRRATATPAPTATPFPTITPTPTPNLAPTAFAPMPEGQSGPFTIEVTEQQLNDYLAGKTFDQQGLTIRDVHIVLGAGEASGALNATHQETGLSVGLTLRGVPHVVDGEAYLQVTDVQLDESVTGLTRILAQAVIEQIIQSSSTEQGIPIPVDNVEVQDVQIVPGKIVITGIRK